jgi:hypothetical protein
VRRGNLWLEGETPPESLPNRTAEAAPVMAAPPSRLAPAPVARRRERDSLERQGALRRFKSPVAADREREERPEA